MTDIHDLRGTNSSSAQLIVGRALSTQQMSESLLNEKLKSEQHRLNYEKLRNLYVKLQHDLHNSQDSLPAHPHVLPDPQTIRRELEAQLHGEVGGPSKRAATDVPNSPGSPDRMSPVLLTRRSPTAQLAQPTSSSAQDNSNFLINNLKKVQPCSSAAGLPIYDGMDDIFPISSLTSVPQNEILRQCSRWKELYLNLLDEFQHYKYGTDALIMSSDDVLAEKVRETNHELTKIKAEHEVQLEKMKSKMDNMIRDKIVMQTEIKALREQLDDTTGKLQEKTIHCETLQRSIDDHNLSSPAGNKRCDIPNHVDIENNLFAAESRVQFLQEEIGEMTDKNAELQDKILSIIQESTKEIATLRKALTGTEESVAKERVDLQSQHEEALQHLQSQQEYIEDLDKFVNERVEKNHEISKQVQDFASQVAKETEQTLQLLEDRLKKTIEEKGELEDSLLRARKAIRELTEEARRQRVTASRFITHIYQILSIPPGDVRADVCELRTLPYVVLSENIVSSIDEDCEMAHTYAIDTKVHMKELLKRIIFWSRQFELQKKRLRDRLTQLEESQNEQKKLTLDEIDRYRKKASYYRDILRKLRQQLGPTVFDASLKKILPPKIYEQASVWLRKNEADEDEELINSLALVHPDTPEKLIEESANKTCTPLEHEASIVSQAQSKFGPSAHLNHRPFISTNLQNYLKKHERFVHILDNVEKYLAKTEDESPPLPHNEDEEHSQHPQLDDDH